MARITTTVFVLVILLNGTATIMDVSGFSDDIGVEMETGVDSAVDRTVDRVQAAFDPNIGSVQSTISLALAAISVFEVVIEGVFAAPTLVINILGGGEVVTAVVTVAFGPMYVLSTLEMISVSLGTETV